MLWLLAQRCGESFLEDDKSDDVQEKGWENHLFSEWEDTKCESTEKIEYWVMCKKVTCPPKTYKWTQIERVDSYT